MQTDRKREADMLADGTKARDVIRHGEKEAAEKAANPFDTPRAQREWAPRG